MEAKESIIQKRRQLELIEERRNALLSLLEANKLKQLAHGASNKQNIVHFPFIAVITENSPRNKVQ